MKSASWNSCCTVANVEQVEREALTLPGHQVVVVVEPGRERGAKRIEVEQRFPGHGRSLPNT